MTLRRWIVWSNLAGAAGLLAWWLFRPLPGAVEMTFQLNPDIDAVDYEEIAAIMLALSNDADNLVKGEG